MLPFSPPRRARSGATMHDTCGVRAAVETVVFEDSELLLSEASSIIPAVVVERRDA